MVGGDTLALAAALAQTQTDGVDSDVGFDLDSPFATPDAGQAAT